MVKTIYIDVPDEIEEMLKNDPKLKESLQKDLIKKLAYNEIEKGDISPTLLDLSVGEEEVTLENEEEIVENLRNKAMKRLDDN